MNWYKEIADNDNMIKSIELTANSVNINILKWNEERVTLVIEDYLKLKYSQAVDLEIGEIIIKDSGSLIDETIQDYINGGGTKDELKGYSEIEFYDPWDTKRVMDGEKNGNKKVLY